MFGRIIFILLITTLSVSVIYSATTHKHVHSTGGEKERLEDGSYVPRSANHYVGDEHNSEFDHEAILGSVKDAKEFDELNPEEAKQRLAVLVIKMDMNQDKFISRNELHAWILRSFKLLSEEDASEQFTGIDVNDDGRITWEEYLSYNYLGQDEDVENLNFNELDHSEDELKMIADDEEMFKASDLNKDGVLDSEEFVMFNSPEEHPQLLPVVLNQTLRDKDLDGDGKISFQEFLGESARHHDKEWLISEKEKFDQEYDKDGDGILNGNEILSWIVPSNE